MELLNDLKKEKKNILSYCDICGAEIPTRKKSSGKCSTCRLKGLKNDIIDGAKRAIEYYKDPRDATYIDDISRSISNSLHDFTQSKAFSICDITYTENKPGEKEWMFEHIFGRDQSARKILEKTIELGPDNLTNEILQDFLFRYSPVVRIQKIEVKKNKKYVKKHTLFNKWIRTYQKGNMNLDSYNEGLQLFGFNLIPEEYRDRFIL